MRGVIRKVFIRNGIYAIILATAGLTALAAVLICRSFPPVNDLTDLSLMAPKVTLLSVIIALGIVQYNYFEQQCTELNDKLEKGDFGPFWADHAKEADKFRSVMQKPDFGTGLTSAQVDTFRANVARMDQAIARKRAEFVSFLSEVLTDFTMRFGILFSIALLPFSSIGLDFVSQVWGLDEVLNPRYFSLVTFFMAILLGLVYLLFLVRLIQAHLRMYHDDGGLGP